MIKKQTHLLDKIVQIQITYWFDRVVMRFENWLHIPDITRTSLIHLFTKLNLVLR